MVVVETLTEDSSDDTNAAVAPNRIRDATSQRGRQAAPPTMVPSKRKSTVVVDSDEVDELDDDLIPPPVPRARGGRTRLPAAPKPPRRVSTRTSTRG